MPEGPILLGQIFDEPIMIPPAVRTELVDLESTPRYGDDIHVAATRLSGDQIVTDTPLTWDDVPERDRARAHMAKELFIPSQIPAETERDAYPAVLLGEHAGESEAIAVALRMGSQILINDLRGREYAADQGLHAEPAPVSLARLYGRYSSRELFDIHKDMERVTRSKVAVTGHLWFSESRGAPPAE